MESYEIKGLTFRYPDAPSPALRGIDLTVRQGEFVVVCGKSGCGKTTLLRHLKTVLAPTGERTGEILFEGTPLDEVDVGSQAARIGFVLQSPDNQLVTDKVWHELAFGLESLGCEPQAIRLRVAEMASFFGIQEWFWRDVVTLSGGQKQLLNLASVMAMQPSVLILDEPTSQLDPIAAGEFLSTVRKINRELGTTMILTEHRLEEVFPMADRALVLEDGRLLADGAPSEVGRTLKAHGHDMFLSMPSAMQIYAGIDASSGSCPLTVKEGRAFLGRLLNGHPPKITALERREELPAGETAVELREVWFRYEKDGPDVVKNLSLTVKKGSIHAIVGGNGTGKTTALGLVGGLHTPCRGKIKLGGRELRKIPRRELYNANLAMLPQNPQVLFVKKTVELDLLEMLDQSGLTEEERRKRIASVAERTEITDLLQMHPYDLSGGEQQRAALAKVLLLEPKILLLDEPTKGLDNCFKQKFAALLKRLASQDVAILMVSHDVEFCAQYADVCSLFFDGGVVSTGAPVRFFSGNSFYTTAANRMSRGIFRDAVRNEDVIALCNLNLAPNEG